LPHVADRAGGPWRRWIDTSLDSPQDIVPWRDAAPVAGTTYRLESRAMALFYAGGD